jgi:hypothetical protein
MKKLFLVAAVLVPLSMAHSQCTVTPSSFTLQVGKTQVFTANSCLGVIWSCAPSGSCGSFSPTTGSSTTYTARSNPGNVTITAKPSSGSSGTAAVRVNAVQINALGLTTGGQAATDFQTLVLGSSNTQVSGYNPDLPWSTADTGTTSSNCSTSSCPGLTTFDNSIVALFPSGITKKINIVVTPLTGGGAIGGTKTNTATPPFVLSQVASYTNCGYSNSPGNGFPNVRDPNFISAYENFINVVLHHYATQSSSAISNYIGYIRFGLSAGGESYPFCQTEGNYDDADWETYVNTMIDYISTTEAGISGQSHPPIQMMTSLNAVLNPPNPPDIGPPDQEAIYANNYGMGFGSQGLQQSDITEFNYPNAPLGPCTSDWCNLFSATKGYSGPFELQTTLQTDPNTSAEQTGSLCQLVPFATYLRAKILELYAWDLLYTYDSASFCANPPLNGAPGDTNYHLTDFCNTSTNVPLYSTAYGTAITNAVTGVAGSPDPAACTPN